MSAHLREHLAALVAQAMERVAPSDRPAILLERPRQQTHGDYATSVAMQLARSLKRAPRDIAGALVAALPDSSWVERAEVAGPGFINFVLRPAAKHDIVCRVLQQGGGYGAGSASETPGAVVEFVSANPTG